MFSISVKIGIGIFYLILVCRQALWCFIFAAHIGMIYELGTTDNWDTYFGFAIGAIAYNLCAIVFLGVFMWINDASKTLLGFSAGFLWSYKHFPARLSRWILLINDTVSLACPVAIFIITNLQFKWAFLLFAFLRTTLNVHRGSSLEFT